MIGVLRSFSKYMERHASPKKKYIRGNQSPFMNNTLSKEIMKKTKLRNNFLKNRIEENRNKYTKQRNFCEGFLGTTKQNYFNSLNEKNITDNRKFWKTLKPMLFNKSITNEKIIAVENEKILSLNNFFLSIIKFPL